MIEDYALKRRSGRVLLLMVAEMCDEIAKRVPDPQGDEHRRGHLQGERWMAQHIAAELRKRAGDSDG